MSLTRRPDLPLGAPYASPGGLELDPVTAAVANWAVNKGSEYAGKLAKRAYDYFTSSTPSRPAKRSRTGRAASAPAQASTGGRMASRVSFGRRVRTPKRIRRRRSVRRKPKRGLTKRSKSGRYANYSRLVSRIPPRAFTWFTKPAMIRGFIYYNNDNDPAISSEVKNFVFRCNDIINPFCINGDDVDASASATWLTNFPTSLRSSVLGLNRIAPMYKEHVVRKFSLTATIKWRNPNDWSAVNQEFFAAWRITDHAPTDVATNTTTLDMLENVVQHRMSGWRYRRLRFSSTRDMTKRIKISIPIRKFYKYPMITQADAENIRCMTPDDTPANWTSPANPCYLQFVLFSYTGGRATEVIVPDYMDGGSSAAVGTGSICASYVMPYSIQFNVGMGTWSQERDPDLLRQSTTTDGGDDASNDLQMDAVANASVAVADEA